MPIIFQYLLKLSISLAIMYIFYQLILRRLTFYNHNRWYLAGYSLLCFIISLVNISPVLNAGDSGKFAMVQYIPTIGALATKLPAATGLAATLGAWSVWNWSLVVLIAGGLFMLARLVIQLISFRRITRHATLIADDEIKFYQVEGDVMPFSFGNSIFINQQLHTEDELKKIIGHEFVHVKQKHTIDIIWSELLCILNWYNPFAWLIKKAIRQNLEFIADNKVIQGGMDKKQYQYLLLKVVGNNHFSIATKFNFTSLKKRIAMMNKIKSARVQLIKFLFILPLLAVLLLAFRDKLDQENSTHQLWLTGILLDNETQLPLKGATVGETLYGLEATTDQNGYFKIPVTPKKGKYKAQVYFIKDGYRTKPFNTPELSINESNSNIAIVYLDNDNSAKGAYMYEKIYKGEAGYDNAVSVFKEYKLLSSQSTPTLTDTIPAKENQQVSAPDKDFLSRHPQVSKISWARITSTDGDELGKTGDAILQVKLKNGDSEMYNIAEEGSVKKFKKIYGELPPPAPSIVGLRISTEASVNMPATKAESLQKNVNNFTGLKVKGIQIDPQPPLYIVDGKELKAGELEQLEPNNINAINVLKGTEAIKLYGSKGANGVLLIETKKAVQLTIVTDSLIVDTGGKLLYMKGNTTIKENEPPVTITADSVKFELGYYPTRKVAGQQLQPADAEVIINGKPSTRPQLKPANTEVIIIGKQAPPQQLKSTDTAPVNLRLQYKKEESMQKGVIEVIPVKQPAKTTGRVEGKPELKEVVVKGYATKSN